MSIQVNYEVVGGSYPCRVVFIYCGFAASARARKKNRVHFQSSSVPLNNLVPLLQSCLCHVRESSLNLCVLPSVLSLKHRHANGSCGHIVTLMTPRRETHTRRGPRWLAFLQAAQARRNTDESASKVPQSPAVHDGVDSWVDQDQDELEVANPVDKDAATRYAQVNNVDEDTGGEVAGDKQRQHHH